MATVEFIQKRIEGKQKELAKLEKKLERIRKVESQNWEDPNPYYYRPDDLKWCLKDLEAVKKSLADYQADLVAAQEKAGSRNIKVILDFLQAWKDRNMQFYQDKFPQYIEELGKFHQKSHEWSDWYNKNGYQTRRNNPDEYKQIEKEFRSCEKQFKEKWNWITPYIDRRQNKETFKMEWFLDTGKLQKDLDQEADRKYDFIIERTNAIVGQITDASNLTVGNKADLNGFIIGTKGTAKVQTIGAGGYNIQCFHFRTLINKVGN